MDMKPPISRAKMILITKAAIKAIKVRIFNLEILSKCLLLAGVRGVPSEVLSETCSPFPP